MKGSGRPTRRDKLTLLLIYEHTSLAREHSQLHAAIVVTPSIYCLWIGMKITCILALLK